MKNEISITDLVQLLPDIVKQFASQPWYVVCGTFFVLGLYIVIYGFKNFQDFDRSKEKFDKFESLYLLQDKPIYIAEVRKHQRIIEIFYRAYGFRLDPVLIEDLQPIIANPDNRLSWGSVKDARRFIRSMDQRAVIVISRMDTFDYWLKMTLGILFFMLFASSVVLGVSWRGHHFLSAVLALVMVIMSVSCVISTWPYASARQIETAILKHRLLKQDYSI